MRTCIFFSFTYSFLFCFIISIEINQIICFLRPCTDKAEPDDREEQLPFTLSATPGIFSFLITQTDIKPHNTHKPLLS